MKPKDILQDAGFEELEVLTNYDYEDAIVGVTTENRVVYSFTKMVEWLMSTENFTYEEAVEWIEYNTIRSLDYYGPKAPIIMYDVEDYR
jgi:hypothetical protein